MGLGDGLSLKDLESNRVGEVYPSRKNKVFRAMVDGELVIAKVYAADRTRAEREYSVLTRAFDHGLRVPQPLSLHEFGILMELIEGDGAGHVFDVLWSEEPASAEVTIRRADFNRAISHWLADFHKAFAFKFTRGDSILKNFVVTPAGFVGVDFEEAVEGDPLNDLGQVCSYVLSADPPFTEAKFACAKEITSGYWRYSGLDRSGELGSKVAEALRYYSRFRRDGESLRQWASRIESEALLG